MESEEELAGSHSLSWWRQRGMLDPPSRMSLPAVVAWVALGVITVAVSATDAGFILPAGLIAAWYIMWSFRRPVVAISTIVVGYLHLMTKTEGISPAEIAFGLYMYGYIGYWWIKTTMIERRRIAASFADRSLIAFVGIGFISVVVILSEGESVFVWFREWVTMAGFLLYFPARDAMKTKKDVRFILTALMLMIGIVAATNIVNYRVSSIVARYVWELVASRKAFGDHFFFPACVVLMSLAIHDRNNWRHALYILLFTSCVLALALTFSRGFWLSAAMGIVVLFFLADSKARSRLMIIGLLAVILVSGVLLFTGGGLGQVVAEAILNRFTSTGSALTDVSVTNRIVESQAVIASIRESPIIGHGMGAHFKYFDHFLKSTLENTYVHNGYLYLLLKVGAVGTFAFLAFFLLQIKQAWYVSKGARADDFMIPFARGVGSVMLLMLVVTVSSNIFEEKQSILLVSLGSAFLNSSGLGNARNRANAPA